jgi:hypothetical protein
MKALPLPNAGGLAGIARRTALVRSALAVALVVLVLLVALSARHPAVRQPSALPVRSGDMIVLDLSASISSDTFSRIGETLRKLVATGGRYGLVVFSNVAYEALPPGSPASALRPLIRYFSVPSTTSPGGAVALPTNPWTLSFSSGTRISAGLDLAHRLLVTSHLPHARVVLISDLADDPEDVQRLNQVAVSEYGPHRTPLRVVALNAAPGDEAFFARISGQAVSEASPAPAGPAPPPLFPASTLAWTLALAIVAVALGLGIYELWSARLSWDASPTRSRG